MAIPLSALLGGGGDDREDDTGRENRACGIPEAQADTLQEFWSIYSTKPAAVTAFKPGDLVMVDPRMERFYPHKWPVTGIPALVISTDPVLIASLRKDDRFNTATAFRDIAIGVNLKDGDKQVVYFFLTSSRFFIPYVAPTQAE